MMGVLRSRWVLTGLGVAAAGAMVWLFGPFLTALSGVMPRALALVALTTAWAAFNALADEMRRRNDRLLSGGIVQAGAAEREETAELADRLNRALGLLKSARGTRGYLYEQPWYVIIGPPGAGKTTALANAGLRFPLAAELGQGELRGVGGTRLCDWSFTDSAVLIDTAGRYTTQDSNAAVDRAGWEGFLDLLRRTRARLPLNGVLVAIGMSDIASGGEAGRLAHARAVRSRIKELNTRLGVRLPVYVIFTKADLVQGFSDFFDDLDRAGRAQVWGVTFPPQTGDAGPAGAFPAAFRSLVAQLSARLIDRLQAERSLERRGILLGFPAQFASLEAPLAAFIDEAFAGTRLDPAPFLRGVYFASATQQGSPMDRLTASLAQGFGVDHRRLDAAPARQGRSYFLERLLPEVIFGEAMLAARDSRASRRRLALRGAAWAGCGIVLAASIGWLGFSAWQSATALTRSDAAVSAYDESWRRLNAEQSLDPVPLAAADLLSVLPLLDRARAAVAQADGDTAAAGLSQRAKLGQSARLLYGRALQYVLLPRLVSLMEAGMRSHAGDTAYLYHVIGPYKMLCCGLAIDAGALHEWLAGELAAGYGGASLATARAALLAHGDALFAHDPGLFAPVMDEVSNDPALVGIAEARLGNMSVADVAYARIRAHALPADVPDFDPGRAAGALAGAHFTRRSGASLDAPVSGFFTPAGFRRVLLARLPDAVDRAIRESVVRGEGAAIDPNDPAKRQQIERDVIRAYTDAYIDQWDGLLADIDIVPPRDSAAAVGDFTVLTSQTGPIARLLGAAASQLALAAPAAGATAPAADPGLSGEAVDKHFEDLRGYVANGDLAANLQTLGRVEAQIEAALGSSAAGAAPAAPGAAARELAGVADYAPEPARRWLRALAARGHAVESTTQREQAAGAFAGAGLGAATGGSAAGGAQALCRRVTQDFPFRPRAGAEASLEEFAALFARDGALDGFFQQYLRPYVSTGAGPWRVHDAGDLAAPIGPAAALAFQNAAMIRDAFFGFGGSTPQVRFALRPVDFDTGLHKVTFDFDGIDSSYEPGGQGGVMPLEWPGPTGMTSVRVNFDPPGDGPALEQSGAWALFRLLRAAQVESTGAERVLRVTFVQGERRAVFDLSTESLRNPFRASLLEHFTCPALSP